MAGRKSNQRRRNIGCEICEGLRELIKAIEEGRVYVPKRKARVKRGKCK